MRLAHAANNVAEICRRFAEGDVTSDVAVASDGHAGYSDKSLGKRPRDAVVQTKAEKRAADCVQSWPLDDLAPEAMADGHPCGRGEAEAPADLSR